MAPIDEIPRGLESGINLNQESTDVDFTRENAQEVYRLGFGDPNMIARWDRILEEINFEQVVDSIHDGRHGRQIMSCPFHGRDSKPSFTLYKRTNSAFCFGCPEGDKYYDSVRFVAAKFGYTRLQAIAWLEREYDLPPLPGVAVEAEEEEDEEADTVVRTLTFNHLARPYMSLAASDIAASGDPERAREYLALFFEAMPERGSDPNSAESIERAVVLARVLGSSRIEEIKKRELHG